MSIGYLGENGVFNLVAAAKRVTTPRAKPAPRRPVQWADVLAMEPGKPVTLVSESPYAPPTEEYLRHQARMREILPLGYGISSARISAGSDTKKT